MQHCAGSWVYVEIASQLGLRCNRILTTNIGTTVGQKDTKEEIFRMTMGQDESLEDKEERFQLSYKRARCTLDPESLKLVLLRGVREDLLDTLHL